MEQNPSRPVVLSRSVVITEESSIPSLLLLGKLVSDGAPDSASLRAKLLQNWGTSAMVNFWRVTDGTFLIQLQEKGDLTRVLDGAPWSCGGDGLFLVQHVKPDVNLVDQVAGFTKAELWVRFHHVPVDHCHPTSVHALAARIGEPVNCELSSSSFEFIRARIRVDITRPLERSVEVELENGKQARVSVEYEGISSSLCGSCGILGHPTNRCGRANQPAAAAPHPREKPPVYVASRLGSRRSTPAPSSPSLTEKSSSRQDDDPPVVETAPAPPEERSGQERLFFSGKGSCSNFLKLICLRMSTKELGEKKPCSTGDNLEDENQSVQTNSVHESVKEPSTMATQEAQLDTTLITRSHFSVTAQGSRSKKHARIEVIMETQCTPQLIMGAMQWISEKAEGLSASYDGKRGVISIFGLQIDQNTDPVDLIAYLFPKTGQKTGFEEGHKNLTAQQDLQTRWCVSMTRTAAKLRSRILEMRKRLASIEQERMGCDYKNTVQCCLIIQNWIIIFTQWR